MDDYLREMIGRYIIERRNALRVSQAEVARRMGFSAQYLGRIEKGKTNLPTDTLKRLIAILEFNEAEVRRIYGYSATLFIDSLFGKSTEAKKSKSR